MDELYGLREKINKTDEAISKLFEERMNIARDIAQIKRSKGLAVFNPDREKEVIERISAFTHSDDVKPYSKKLFSTIMDLSKDYQRSLMGEDIITVSSSFGAYPIYVIAGALSKIDTLFDLNSKVAIITDSGVPAKYSKAVLDKCKSAEIFTVAEGEGSKSLNSYEKLCKALMDFGLSRGDAIVAVGGGVVGDLAAFVAATYMRGVRFYNVPTTLLSMVDSSIGGKCGINFSATKNVLGAFYPPSGVLIDTDTLATLPKAECNSGLAEIVKLGVSLDEKLFSLLENAESSIPTEDIIRRAVCIKKHIVESDEKENGLRRVLNFGHTLGHGIEALGGRRHGECVALGMLPFISEEIRERVTSLLSRLGLSTSFSGIDRKAALDYVKHDKKGNGEIFDCVYSEKIGSFEIKRTSFEELCSIFLEYNQ